jgi:hypothetical protein
MGPQRAASNHVHEQLVIEGCPGAKPLGYLLYVYSIAYHLGSIYSCHISQVWARGMVKKRHPHAHHIVSFIYNPGAKRRGHLLKRKTDFSGNKNNRWQNMGIFLDINVEINRIDFQKILLYTKRE